MGGGEWRMGEGATVFMPRRVLPGCCSACGEGCAWISAKTEGKDARQVPECLRKECHWAGRL